MDTLHMSPKDKLIYCTKSDHEKPSIYDPPPALPGEQKRGVILENGEINWTCPCLGGLPYGPCGFEFREFFSCLHGFQSKDEDAESKKAQECFPKFASMRECFSQFPKLYPPDDDDQLESSTTQLNQESKNPEKRGEEK